MTNKVSANADTAVIVPVSTALNINLVIGEPVFSEVDVPLVVNNFRMERLYIKKIIVKQNGILTIQIIFPAIRKSQKTVPESHI